MSRGLHGGYGYVIAGDLEGLHVVKNIPHGILVLQINPPGHALVLQAAKERVSKVLLKNCLGYPNWYRTSDHDRIEFSQYCRTNCLIRNVRSIRNKKSGVNSEIVLLKISPLECGWCPQGV